MLTITITIATYHIIVLRNGLGIRPSTYILLPMTYFLLADVLYTIHDSSGIACYI